MKKASFSILIAAALGLTTSAAFGGVYSSTSGVLTDTAVPTGFAFADSNKGSEPLSITGFNYTGTTVGGPTFNRPLANGNSAPTSLSGVGTAVAYDVVQFTIAAAGNYVFLSTSVTPANWDNYTVLYQTSFNPASPLTNALIANDDNPTIGKAGFTYALQTGVSYFFVTTGFANTDAGSFSNTLAAVPEPGTWVMLGAGLVGLMVFQRARRQAA